MANNEHHEPNAESRRTVFAGLGSFGPFPTVLLVFGLLGLLGAAALGGPATANSVSGIDLFFQSYTYGYIFWLMLALGCLGLLIINNCIRATWAVAIQRVAEAGASTLPVMFLLGLPLIIAMFMGDTIHLYPWASSAAKHDAILVHKALYLNPVGVLIRYILCFAIWIYYYWYFTKSPKGSLAQDQSLDNRLGQARVNVAAPGIVVYGLTMTFFFTDLVMSLDPHWFSTIYGVWWAMIGVGAAISMGTIFITSFHNNRPYDQIVTPALTKDLGNMMFGMTMLWGYFSVSQVLIHWSGNLPEEVSFHYARFKGPLATLGFLIILGQFFTPFLLLLSGRTKRTPHLLRAVASIILTVRMVDVWYQIEPFFNRQLTDFPALAVDFAAWAFVGGIWLLLMLGEFKKHSPVLLHDTRLQEAKANAGHH